MAILGKVPKTCIIDLKFYLKIRTPLYPKLR